MGIQICILFNAKIQENYNLKSHNGPCINTFDQIKSKSSLWSSGCLHSVGGDSSSSPMQGRNIFDAGASL